MKIYEFCPFNNENLIKKLKLEEDKNWIHEVHITESNKNFHYSDKDYNFINENHEICRYHVFDAKKEFRSSGLLSNIIGHRYMLSKDYYTRNMLKQQTWYNEAVQRNKSCSWINPNDDDIIILADIDEIIDSRYADRIIEETKKRGIITVKLYFTLFYFNLFSKNWGGAPDYSYRIFIMTGKYFKSMNMTSDKLRKLGEQGKLINDIYCINDFCGFHHSWLGDEIFISNKINSYAHKEHEQYNSIEYIKQCLKNKKSIFPGQELYIDNNKQFLNTVEKYKYDLLKNHFAVI